jgi:hypothetical protein
VHPQLLVNVNRTEWTLTIGQWKLTLTHTGKPVIPEAFKDLFENKTQARETTTSDGSPMLVWP